jgi:hypothetical protein
MKKKTLTLLLLLIGSAGFGLGALVEPFASHVAAELQNRSWRERNNADMFGPLSASAGEYFNGRADGYAAAARVNLKAPHVAAYLQGFGSALEASAVLIVTESETRALIINTEGGE